MTAKPSGTVMLLTEAFPIRGTSPAEPKPYIDKEYGGHIADRQLVFVTGRGRAGIDLLDPALNQGRGGTFSGNPCPAPVRGPPALMPLTGPRLLPPIFNGDPSGVWVRRGPERGQGLGIPKKAPRPRPFSRVGRGKGLGAHIFEGPVRPVTNSTVNEARRFPTMQNAKRGAKQVRCKRENQTS